MSLIVEDGTGLSTAEVYSSLEDFKAYRPRGGLTIPTGTTDPNLESALIRGTAFADAAFPWPGIKYAEGQALAWPREYAYDLSNYYLEGVPTCVKYLCMEAALIELATPGALSLALERGGKKIRSKTGPIEDEWSPSAPGATVYPILRQCVRSIVTGSGVMKFGRG